MVFEEKKSEEWFLERYLPCARHEKEVVAKREWARAEASRFSVSHRGPDEMLCGHSASSRRISCGSVWEWVLGNTPLTRMA